MKPVISLTKAVLIAVLPQHQQFYRPYHGNVDKEIMEKVYNSTNEGKTITRQRLSGVASSIIEPSFTPVAEVYIPNGFSEMRFAFIIELTIESVYGIEIEIIKGFTDTANISYSGFIDPNLKFFVNSKTLLSANKNINNDYNVKGLKGDYNVLNRVNNYDSAVSLVPESAVIYNQTGDMRNTGNIINDTRILLKTRSKLNNIKHNIPSHYLADVCNGYIKGYDPFTEPHEFGSLSPYDNILSFVTNETVSMSYFYSELNLGNEVDHTGYLKDYVTYSDINRVWPKHPSFWYVIKPAMNKQLRSPMENTQHWGGAIMETSIAFSLTHILPGIMSDYLLEKLRVTITNMTIGNQISIQPISYISIAKETMNELLMQNLCGRLELDVVNGLLLQKANSFFITMDIDLFNTSYFEIALDDGIKIPYSAPMFCDSYYSPMIGLDSEPLAQIADSVEIIAKELFTTQTMFNDAPSINQIANNIIEPKIQSFIPNTATIPTNKFLNNQVSDNKVIPTSTLTIPPNKYL